MNITQALNTYLHEAGLKGKSMREQALPTDVRQIYPATVENFLQKYGGADACRDIGEDATGSGQLIPCTVSHLQAAYDNSLAQLQPLWEQVLRCPPDDPEAAKDNFVGQTERIVSSMIEKEAISTCKPPNSPGEWGWCGQ